MKARYISRIFPKKTEYTDEGYCVCVYSADNPEDLPNDIRATNGDRFTASGNYLPQYGNIKYELDGKWTTTKYGKQFQVDASREDIDNTIQGITAYLGCGVVRGIGPVTAARIVDKFGLDTLEIFDKYPERLKEVKGISKKKSQKIIASYHRTKAMQRVFSALCPFGITANAATKVYNTFRDESVRIIATDTFRLCKIKGFGFKTVDKIARQNGLDPNNATRIREAALYWLSENNKNGHLFAPKKDFFSGTFELLSSGSDVAIDKNVFGEVIRDMRREGAIVSDMFEGDCVYAKNDYDAERNVAEIICERLETDTHKGKQLSDEEIDRVIPEITLAEKQKEAINMFLRHNTSIITGGPGTGKTTTLKAVLSVFEANCRGDIVLLAPTGRAARRMTECTGTQAKTIHSALSILSDEESHMDETLDAGLVVVDEFSMVDMSLAYQLFKHINNSTKVLLIGDPDQLPSVGAGNVFRELIQSGVIPCTKLDVVFRQDEKLIICNADSINTGGAVRWGKGFEFVGSEDETSAADLVIDRYLKASKEKGIDNVQILSPLRNRGDCSVNSINARLREMVNPEAPSKKEGKVGRRIFREGDRIMQMKNNSMFSNGDIGTLVAINTDEFGDTEYIVDFGGKRASYDEESMLDVEFAYASTVHKSQGSEYDTVILVLMKSFYIMLKRNLLYTAVTRAKSNVIIIGQREAVNISIRNNDIEKRNTMLGRLITDVDWSNAL